MHSSRPTSSTKTQPSGCNAATAAQRDWTVNLPAAGRQVGGWWWRGEAGGGHELGMKNKVTKMISLPPLTFAHTPATTPAPCPCLPRPWPLPLPLRLPLPPPPPCPALPLPPPCPALPPAPAPPPLIFPPSDHPHLLGMVAG